MTSWGFSELLDWGYSPLSSFKTFNLLKKIFFNFLAVLPSMWNLSSPNKGSNLGPLLQKREVLTTGLRGKSRSPPFKQLSTYLVQRLPGPGISVPGI